MAEAKRFSLFSKLFVVLLLTGVLISLVVGAGQFFFMNGHGPGQGPGQQMGLIGKSVVAQMGNPPHFPQGQALAKKLGVAVRIEAKGWSWSSSPDIPFPEGAGQDRPQFGPPPAWFRMVPFFLMPLVQVFRSMPKGPPPTVFDYDFADGPAKVVFLGHLRPGPGFREPSFTVMWFQLAAIALILLASYFVIRWVLKPIASLDRGVRAIAAGHLAHRVPVESRDELGSLAVAFNEMGTKVREMIDSKQQLLVDVSHELRSPLTRAKVGLGLLNDGETVKQIGQDLDELEAMIGNLLESARLSNANAAAQMKLVTTDLVALSKVVADQYRSLGKRLELTVGASPLFADVDAERVQSALRNLIENALKYSPEEKSVRVSLAEKNGMAHFKVRDEGAGIAVSDLDKVFDPFYRVDKSRTRKTGGFGLGLGLCRRIAEAHGGQVRLESEIGKGTTAILTIPLRAKSTT